MSKIKTKSPMTIELVVTKIKDSRVSQWRNPEKVKIEIGKWPLGSGVSIVIDGFEYLFEADDLKNILEFLKSFKGT